MEINRLLSDELTHELLIRGAKIGDTVQEKRSLLRDAIKQERLGLVIQTDVTFDPEQELYICSTKLDELGGNIQEFDNSNKINEFQRIQSRLLHVQRRLSRVSCSNPALESKRNNLNFLCSGLLKALEDAFYIANLRNVQASKSSTSIIDQPNLDTISQTPCLPTISCLEPKTNQLITLDDNQDANCTTESVSSPKFKLPVSDVEEFKIQQDVANISRQLNDLTVNNMSRTDKLNRKLTKPPSEEERVHITKRNLLPAIQKALALQQITTIEELIHYGRAVEESYWRAQQYHPPPTNPKLMQEPGLAYRNGALLRTNTNELFVSATQRETLLQKCWNYIYQKRQKKGKETTGRSGSTKSKPWALADMLAFLEAAEHKRETMTNITIQDNHIMPSLDETSVDKDVSTETVNDTQVSQTIENPVEPIQNCSSWRPPIKRQRHNNDIIQMMEMRSTERQEIVRSLQAKEGDIDLFFKSIALSVKKVRPDLINDAKLMSLQMVFQLEVRNKQLTGLPHISPDPSTSSSMYSYIPPNSNSYDETDYTPNALSYEAVFETL
ncbi:hypothetical protein RN001_009361 [Aquatica leii]|uniref:Uncharacterized protein n=1 Tax=Aquatica leii TaxID=1421715 RepID=A0AAN7SPW5_9COLE|nr:hypothetical protein RN001_009361 [Aquatica leii]